MAGEKGNLDGVESSPIVQARDKIESDDWRRETAVVLSGFLGTPLKGPDDRPIPGRDVDGTPKWRLYRTLAMDEYIEFSEGDVLHIENESRRGQNAASAPDADERVLIWIKSSARVTPIREFFAGEIAASYMAEADVQANLTAIVAGNIRFVTRAGGTEAPPCKG